MLQMQVVPACREAKRKLVYVFSSIWNINSSRRKGDIPTKHESDFYFVT